jgi:glyoxylase-like metal-dependent hydrolase (beta-lactamase superfamily II)
MVPRRRWRPGAGGRWRVRCLEVCFELAPPAGRGLRFIAELNLRFFLRLGVPAALEFGSGLAGDGPDVAAVGGPRLVPGAGDLEPVPFGAEDVRAVVITHAHPDRIGAAERLRR